MRVECVRFADIEIEVSLQGEVKAQRCSPMVLKVWARTSSGNLVQKVKAGPHQCFRKSAQKLWLIYRRYGHLIEGGLYDPLAVLLGLVQECLQHSVSFAGSFDTDSATLTSAQAKGRPNTRPHGPPRAVRASA